MRKGDNALALFKDYINSGLEPPEGLLPPDVFPGYEEWYSAFWELNTTRSFFEGGIGPIPITAIMNWPGIAPDELDTFIAAMRAMDLLWREEYNEEVKAQIAGKKRKRHPREVYKK